MDGLEVRDRQRRRCGKETSRRGRRRGTVVCRENVWRAEENRRVVAIVLMENFEEEFPVLNSHTHLLQVPERAELRQSTV